ncbi:UbiA family prenyltransferase [Brevundimonas sp.]|uniref:UbiA family prenyltransferase n=1 Tax=Brevundimonas sp. TaxID=1871086 RepID=UPI002737F01A|nr:UbiA family prenyltransferase [Brevundimonas sp.]MDP3802550.1 UbiA family prenyltransferase [Brevundimonas sp.]
MTSAPLPDAGSNWDDRHAPESLKPWLKLGRFDRPVGIWLLLLPGWQGIALALSQYRRTPDLYDAWLVLGFALGAGLMRAAGCAFNDIVDRDIDAKVSRTAMRPIPSGRISVKQAWAFVIGCSLISLLILLTLNPTAVLLGVASLALVAAYPFMKRITWWPQAWLGLTFNWGALMGFAAAAASWGALVNRGGTGILVTSAFGAPSGWAESALLLYLGLVFWTLGYDTIYALQDIEDDAMVGVKSSARRLGPNVCRGVGVFYLLTIALVVAAGAAAGLGPLFYVALLPFAAHLGWQVVRLPGSRRVEKAEPSDREPRQNDPALALRLFRSNRDAGLILLFAIILGAVSWPF